MKVTITCKSCSETFEIEYMKKDHNAWKSGMVIQKAMPYLSLDERELLITGNCGTCFDTMCKTASIESEFGDLRDWT